MWILSISLWIASSSIPLSFGSNLDSEFACPVGWYPLLDLCYKVVPSEQNLSWLEGNLLCELEGGYLAEPTDGELSEFLFAIAEFYFDIESIQSFFIGLEDIGREGRWICPYSQLSPSQMFWGESYPNVTIGNSDDCAIMNIDLESDEFYWRDIRCDEKINAVSICQVEMSQSSSTTSSTASSSEGTGTPGTTGTSGPTTTTFTGECPGDWPVFEGHCYYFSSEATTWDEAESDCQSHGAHLASVHSMQENDFLGEQASSTVYLGGKLQGSDFGWIDGSAFDFSNWQNGYPVSERECLDRGRSGTWFNVFCTEKHYYVCKI